jgi:hypothetical protein
MACTMVTYAWGAFLKPTCACSLSIRRPGPRRAEPYSGGAARTGQRGLHQVAPASRWGLSVYLPHRVRLLRLQLFFPEGKALQLRV